MKNKIKKLIPYILTMMVLTGSFSFAPEKVEAQVSCSSYFSTGSATLSGKVSQAMRDVITANPSLANSPATRANAQQFRDLVAAQLGSGNASPSHSGNCNLSPNSIGVRDPGSTTGETYDVVRVYEPMPDPSNPVPISVAAFQLGRPLYNNNATWDFIVNGGQGTPLSEFETCMADPNKVPEMCTGLPGSTTPEGNKTEASGGDLSPFDKKVQETTCNILGSTFGGGTFQGCILQLVYWTFYTLGGWLLALAATFFNYLIEFTINNDLLRSDFVNKAWGVTRDLSNLFFIIILIYTAIETILGTSHETKKRIANVIIMALLINFSMFFTKVVIDTSNVLALVFYDKIDSKNEKTQQVLIDPTTGRKDLSGGLTKSFNPVYKLDAEFFAHAGDINLPGIKETSKSGMPISILIGITLIAGCIMLFAAYALFVSAFSFLSRLIELFVLLIFAPFAFMSFALPKLAKLEYIGWESWSSRLLKVAFMAPIFMFFLYFIFLLLGKEMFTSIKGTGVLQTLLNLIIPALVVMTLLIQATKFAKKASGQFGDALSSAVKVASGLAIGAATGGTALLATGTLGRLAQNTANNDELKKKALEGDKWAQRKLSTANYFADKSFDVRQTGLGKFTAKQTGVDFNKGTKFLGISTEDLKGGRNAQEKHAKEKGIEKAKIYELSASAAEKQNRRATQYEIDKKIAQQNIGTFRGNDEKEFRAIYEAGGSLSDYGIEKVIEKGRVASATEINKERRSAYAESLEKKHHEDEARGAMSNVYKAWKQGVTPATAATIGTIGLATGGAGLAAAAVVIPFLKALKSELSHVHLASPEVTSAIRKGEDPNKQLISELKKLTEKGGDHGAELSNIAKKMSGGGDEKKDHEPSGGNAEHH